MRKATICMQTGAIYLGINPDDRMSRTRPIERQQRSEIGPIGNIEVSTASNNRRGFLTNLVTSREDAEWLVRRLENENAEPGHTRLTVRAFVSTNLIQAGIFGSSQVPIEAVIPIGRINSANGDQNEYSVVYFGRNRSERNQSVDHASYSSAVELAIRSSSQETINSVAAKSTVNGYSVNILDRGPLTPHAREEIEGLLGVFKYNSEDVREMLERQSNVIFVATHGNRIVGIGVAERADIFTANGLQIPVMEIVGASVSREHGGNNLYSVISSHLIDHIANAHPEVELVYSETNLGHQSLLQTAADQGRQFATGNPSSENTYGILQRHAPVQGEYTDHIVTYINRDGLDQIRMQSLLR